MIRNKNVFVEGFYFRLVDEFFHAFCMAKLDDSGDTNTGCGLHEFSVASSLSNDSS